VAVSSTDALELIGLLENAGVTVWVDGGWGVDALLGEQTRPHDDLDVAIPATDLPALHSALAAQGFVHTPAPDDSPWNFVMTDPHGRRLDVHAMTMDGAGSGWYGPADAPTLGWPADDLAAEGTIGGVVVRCPSARWQVDSHDGYTLDATDRADIRALCRRFDLPVPRRALEAAADDPAVVAWLADLGFRVESSRPMVGGVVSLTELLCVFDRDGAGHQLVLRRAPLLPDVPDHNPSLDVTREVDLLQRRTGSPTTPRLVASDVDGGRCGVPAALVNRLPGMPIVAPDDVDAWVRGLAGAVASVRAHPTSTEGINEFEPWFTLERPPTWTTVPRSWQRAIDDPAAGPPPGHARGLVHRDLHPGNVLFDEGKFSGLVDWTHASVGFIEVDVCRCRVEVALLAGIDVADAFLDACAAVPGVDPMTYDRRWDAVAAVELAPWVEDLLAFNDLGAHLEVATMRATLDDLVTQAQPDGP
jgi:lincosamide nucleotidyltransferase A/C/D/E